MGFCAIRENACPKHALCTPQQFELINLLSNYSYLAVINVIRISSSQRLGNIQTYSAACSKGNQQEDIVTERVIGGSARNY